MARAVRVDAGDSVATLVDDANAGEAIAGFDVVPASAIPRGHKVALAPIAAGEAVVKYGFPIGHARRAIAAGEHVHSDNLRTGLAGTLSLDLFAVPAAQCTEAGLAGATPIGSSGAGLAGTPTGIVAADRSLFSGAAEDLCARISVPTEIGNEFQNASADLQLTFLAEQDPTDPHR